MPVSNVGAVGEKVRNDDNLSTVKTSMLTLMNIPVKMFCHICRMDIFLLYGHLLCDTLAVNPETKSSNQKFIELIYNRMCSEPVQTFHGIDGIRNS